MNKRQSGILLHISSLPSKYGIGDLGEEAYDFVDNLVSSKQSIWQMLPLNPTSPISESSPYSSPSAFASNPLFISPKKLYDIGLISKKELHSCEIKPSCRVVFKKVISQKTKILKSAYKNFKNIKKTKSYNNFLNKNKFWLEDYCLFMSIKEEIDDRLWTKWPKKIRTRDKNELQRLKSDLVDTFEKHVFLQYQFNQQFLELKKYSNQKNIELMGDIPIYVNLDSSDVWANSRFYKLNEDLKPNVVAGVPPDYFSKTGQRWGNPVYDWSQMEKEGFLWWVQRIQLNLAYFNILRIDHFRGLINYWEIPAKERTAIKGRWCDVPTDEFFKAINTHCKDLVLLAEDLGMLTQEVRDKIDATGIPGMKILLFAFKENMQTHPYLPHNYDENCVVYTGTHDNNTVLGWFENEATKEEKQNIQSYIDRKVSKSTIHWDLIELAFSSKARVCIIPLQDVLGLGQDSRMNKPATVQKNWVWRLQKGQFLPSFQKKIADFVKMYDR